MSDTDDTYDDQSQMLMLYIQKLASDTQKNEARNVLLI